jgi:hypothetical protein
VVNGLPLVSVSCCSSLVDIDQVAAGADREVGHDRGGVAGAERGSQLVRILAGTAGQCVDPR